MKSENNDRLYSGYAMVVHGRPQNPKNTSFWGSPSPQGSHSPHILGDTTRPGHVTCVLVWSKSDRRRLRKTLHKQTDKQTDSHFENNGHLAVNQYTDSSNSSSIDFSSSDKNEPLVGHRQRGWQLGLNVGRAGDCKNVKSRQKQRNRLTVLTLTPTRCW